MRHLGKSPGKARQEQASALQIEDGAKDIVQVHFARCRAFIVKYLKNRNSVASPCCATCIVFGGAPCYFLLAILLYEHFPREGEGGGKLCTNDIAWVGFSVHADSLQQRLRQ